MPEVCADLPTVGKKQPARKFDELFTLTCGGLKRPPQVKVGNIVQQKHGSDDPSQFPKCKVQLILAVFGAKSPENGRRGDLARFYRHGGPHHIGVMRLNELPPNWIAE